MRLCLLALLAVPLLAQGPTPPPSAITAVTVAPSGACSVNQGRLVGPGGTIWTCQSGTWAQATSGGGGVSGVTGTAPVASSGGATPAISCTTCATTTNGGALSATAPAAISAAGVISVGTATTGALGVVKPDGTTITVSAGTISASGGVPATPLGALISAGATPGTISSPAFASAHGVVANGSTDDTAAWTTLISATCNGTTGGLIIAPVGTSIVQAGQLKLPNYCYIAGQGQNASVIERKSGSNGVLVDISGTATGAGNHVGYAGLSGLTLNGNNGTGALLRHFYANQLTFMDLRFLNNLDNAIISVETWDSSYIRIFVDTCGSTSQTPYTYTGSSLLFVNGTASSGFGSSTDSNNNINFVDLRVETFPGEALYIGNGLASTNAGNFSFLRTKLETTNWQPSGYHFIDFGTNARNIHFVSMYVALDSLAAGSTFSNSLIFMENQEGVYFNDVSFYVGATGIVSGFDTFTNTENAIDNVFVDDLPAQTFFTAIITVHGGSNVPYRNVTYGSGSATGIAYPALSDVGPLVAANNLSDLTTAATARTNLGIPTCTAGQLSYTLVTGSALGCSSSLTYVSNLLSVSAGASTGGGVSVTGTGASGAQAGYTFHDGTNDTYFVISGSSGAYYSGAGAHDTTLATYFPINFVTEGGSPLRFVTDGILRLNLDASGNASFSSLIVYNGNSPPTNSVVCYKAGGVMGWASNTSGVIGTTCN